jgi:hypothetical protein
MSTITTSANHRIPERWIWIATAATVFGVMLVAILLVVKWPFTQAAVTKALQDRFARQVTIRSFRKTYFPPGCVVEGVEFLHRTRKDLPPLITVQRLTIRSGYRNFLRIHDRVDYVQVVGLHVTVPPKDPNGGKQVFPLTHSTTTPGDTLNIGEISTDNAVLEFISKDSRRERFTLTIDHLILDDVGENGPLAFHARFKNTEPPGDVRSDGQVGPWNDEDPGATPVSGSYTYEHVTLGVFEGIAGTLASSGNFGGTLGQIQAQGSVDVPDFRVSGSSHAMHLSSNYRAEVDGTNGDTHLAQVETHLGNTTVISQGDVLGHTGEHGKTVRLAMNVDQGRIEDLLSLFSGSPRPAETGDVRLRVMVDLAPGSQGFLRRLRSQGEFGIGGGRFTNPNVQTPVNRLAEGARGESKKQQETDPTTVVSNLHGHVSAVSGVARLSNVSFTEPGTLAQVEGTYNLVNSDLDLHGVLHTTGNLSDTTSGFKALVLKALGPFVKRKSVTVVPFTIKGTANRPVFALDLAGKRSVAAEIPSTNPR